MYERHGAVHHVDGRAGAWLYRVFLLGNSLQVDIAFVPHDEFGARAPTFRSLFGTAVALPQVQPPSAQHLIGWGWLHALHVRSALARGKVWQAEYMISAVRDNALAAACRRHGLPAAEGRGMDQLPADLTGPLLGALVASLEPDELIRAFGVAIGGLMGEAREIEPSLAARIEPALEDLLSSTRAAVGARPPA